MEKKPRRNADDSGLSIRPRYIILFFVLMFFILGGVYISQQTKLTSIAEEKAVLQSQLDELKVEEERLDRMLEYMQTDEYLVQYAREKLGYVFPTDVKFYDDAASTGAAAVNSSLTGENASATGEPLATPVPFDVPTDDPNNDEYFVPITIE